MSDDAVLVWRVEGPGVHEDADMVLYDCAEDAGIAAAEAAEYAWIEMEGSGRKPGPVISIRCYEIPRVEWAAMLASEDSE